jgi:hypothetical protein
MATIKQYRVKHIECDLWIAERHVPFLARWSPDKNEALINSNEYWDKNLNPEIRDYLILEEVENG